MALQTQGELWTHGQLRVLRERRFSAQAVAAFLHASQQHAKEVRAGRPDVTRQARLWMCVGAGSWLAFAVGSREVRRQLPAGLVWWAACALMLDWHLGMVETPDGHPRMLGSADALTLARAWLVPLVWNRPTALTCTVAGITDAVDGPLARRHGPTRAGRDFDWIVDACFAAAALRGSGRHGLLERWAVRAEATWLSLGAINALHAYFLKLNEPDRFVTRSARALVPLRIAGLAGGAAGHRRGGSALLGGGALASVAAGTYEFSRRFDRPPHEQARALAELGSACLSEKDGSLTEPRADRETSGDCRLGCQLHSRGIGRP
jgi:hypothetical protein